MTEEEREARALKDWQEEYAKLDAFFKETDRRLNSVGLPSVDYALKCGCDRCSMMLPVPSKGKPDCAWWDDWHLGIHDKTEDAKKAEFCS